jgi:hypothetical protein
MQIVFFNYIICIFVRLFAEKIVKITNICRKTVQYSLIYVHKQDYDDFIIIKFMMR